jgi:hypothetical protein
MSENGNAEKDPYEKSTEKLLNELADYLDDICGKLDTIQILLFIIALPVIIGIIFVILLFTGLLTTRLI